MGSPGPARGAAVAVALLVAAAGCYRRPPVGEPLAGAVEATFADSVPAVLAAAAQALSDEGLSLQAYDDRRAFVESRLVAIRQLNHLTVAAESYVGPDQTVRFRFIARRTFGASRLYGEVTYEPYPDAGRRGERAAAADNPARAVLARMMARIDERLRRGER